MRRLCKAIASLTLVLYLAVGVLPAGVMSARALSAADTTPPTSVTNIDYVISMGNVIVTWSAASDNVGVAGYEVTVARPYQIISKFTTTDTFTRNVGRADQYYYVTVRAYDAAGNYSEPATVYVPTTKH